MQLFEISTTFDPQSINEGLEAIDKAFLEESVYDVLGSAQTTLSQKRGMFQQPDANAVAIVAAIMLYIDIQEGRTMPQGVAAFYEQDDDRLMDVLKYYIQRAPEDFARKKAEVIRSAKQGHIVNDIRMLIAFFKKRESDYDRARRDGTQNGEKNPMQVGKAQPGRDRPHGDSFTNHWSAPTHSLA